MRYVYTANLNGGGGRVRHRELQNRQEANAAPSLFDVPVLLQRS